MGGRIALVVGSDCDAFGAPLGFIADRARDLLDTLVDLGEWNPAGDRTGPLLDPTIDEFKTAVKAAFAEASAQQATLLVAFIGHGQSDGGDDYFLFAKDSGTVPDSDTAFQLSQRIREHLKAFSGIDGFVCLVDACEAGEAARGAGSRWLHPLVAAGGRMELMVASSGGDAYDGCFTRTLVATARQGQTHAGEVLLCSDIKPALVQQCTDQTPVLLSFDGVTVISDDSTDRGLYLVVNQVRRGGALSGTAAMGVIDQLTRGVVVTSAVAEAFLQLQEHDAQRLRVVVGSAGAGKSTLVSLLLRHELVEESSDQRIHAVVFLDASSSRQSVAENIAEQLRRSVEEFGPAADRLEAGTSPEELNTLDALERQVTRPLAAITSGRRRVRILIDGLDQPDTLTRTDVLGSVAVLADPARGDLSHVRVIATARDSLTLADIRGFDHAQVITLPAPSSSDLADFISRTRDRRDLAIDETLLADLPADGGWLVARLLSEIEDRFLP